MDAMEMLLGRRSAVRLQPPGPDEAALRAMLESAMRAPDHGRLRPWHFVVVPENRRERFGELLADSLRRREPDASDEALRREREKALRAPMIVVVAARLRRGHKIPEVEQLLSAGAAATNIMLAARAQGFGAMWKTGSPAHDPAVRHALGLDPDSEIVGFLYVGTEPAQAPSPPGGALADHVSIWSGDAAPA